jgi:hypothetical protein
MLMAFIILLKIILKTIIKIIILLIKITKKESFHPIIM